MKFRNYCTLILTETRGVVSEIEKISESKVNVLDAKGILIATFSSNLEPCEITEIFKANKRNFFLFDLSTESSGVNIMKKDIHQGLFGFINDVDLEEKARDLLDTIHEAKIGAKIKLKKESEEITEEDIKKMKTEEKKELFDKILDKGVDKMTENDKKILPFLAK
jgi:hypothetical protein